MTVITAPPTFTLVSAPQGQIRVPPARALALAHWLAQGTHPWRHEGGRSTDLPLPQGIGSMADIVTEADLAFADEQDPDDPGVTNVRGFWRPHVLLSSDGGSVTWKPWSGNAKRWIRIHRSGTISWDSGTGRESTFVGGCLVAAAGGLAALTPLEVRLVEETG